MHPDFDLSSQIRRFEDQYERNPDSLIFARLADLHRKAGSPRRALEVLERGLDRHPDYLSAHIVRARALQAIDRLEGAEAAYRRVLDLDRQNLVALRALAELARDRGDMDEARERYERLLRVDPRYDQARVELDRLVRRTDAGAPEDEATSEDEGTGRTGSDDREPGTPPTPGGGPTGPGEPAETRQELAGEVRSIVAEVRERFARPEEGGTGDGSTDVDAADDVEATDGVEAAEGDGEAEGEELVTETLAHLYASQGFYEEAIEMYEEMSRSRPDDPALRERLAAARARARGEEPDEAPPPRPRRGGSRDANGTGDDADPTAGSGRPAAGPSSGEGRNASEALDEIVGGESPVPTEAPTPTARQHLKALLRSEAIPGYANQLLREARGVEDEEA